MTQLLRKLGIKYRLMGYFSLFFALSMAVFGGAVYSVMHETVMTNIERQLDASTEALRAMVQSATDASVRNRLRAIAEKNRDILVGLEAEVQAGRMTGQAARTLARTILLSQSIGQTGYVYCITSKGVVAVHPNEQLLGQDLSGQWIGREQAKRLTGYMEYEWANPGEMRTRPKALYMVYFEPWDWIISASAYRQEFTSLINVEDFRAGVASFRVGDSGYAFILDGEGNMVFHPWLKGNMTDAIDAAGTELFQHIRRIRDGKIAYSWLDPGRDTPRDKLMHFRSLPELGWIVASSSYLDEVYAPLRILGTIIVVAVLLTLLLTLPLCYALGLSISRPLTVLMTRMRDADRGDLSVRADENARGEMGSLSMHFNRYMDRLVDFRDELRAEIDERTRAEQRLRLYEKVFENALEGISITDKSGVMVAVNPAFTTITGFTSEEVIGKNPRVLKSDMHGEEFYGEMWTTLKARGSWHGEIWNRRKNGESYPEILSISSIRDDDGEIANYVAVFHDISDMKHKEEQLAHHLYHDGLTGLPNRVLVLDRLSMALSHANRTGTKVAVLFLDLDNFKKINDSFGHAQGDTLLKAVAERLVALYRDEDTVARQGGDEFLVVVVDVHEEREVVDLAEGLQRVFEEPFVIKGQEVFITPSIGVTLYPDDGQDPASLVKNADMAMYQSKAKGRNSYFLFTQQMSERIAQRLTLESDMRRALKEREFTVYFQPKVDLASGEVSGLEALVRWVKPDGIIVSPEDFIPMAEETGLIVPLGEFVLDASCKAMQVLQGVGCSALTVAVNLSPIQFGQEDLVEMVVANLERNGLPASRLELEITESTLMTDVQSSVAQLNRLVELGITISIDDFGTGYSSLYYLKNFPISTLKIDRSFIRDITIDDSDAKIVETVVLMARTMGIGVVAEGVETKEQLDLLATFGCATVQGYYYSRPLPLEKIIEFLLGKNGVCTIRR
ncbi:MAG: EAL domain-containing protein [Pseudodesulfovibrio sp.]|uniref:Diguanylate cyclase n=1 Tax=Pseudodesulfovibrio aespoeensis (strain ATCC 700646 / DSM 10631 / Aspo-2) TaxID=643562 RepID=E6VS07_PSEA9|nr:EAL domain-containing protein [Pseudodesulfovibrio sp.]ADU61940.1 diguanylate cyclase [Pseudodesulfovibrio aespoeensis Aspo-2]MBU4379465.1 EAL domain-containing protein [Pseudomonadota bacterium]MBU4473704.1 EAL domain-containing protein [Pseudomonadota bacterium]MBU4514692.1 EAL domain-containing protein [Pseudomonadota bacterium]MBU4522024.1 EAL domain-containing protein [Pseudomonadota bacterium]